MNRDEWWDLLLENKETCIKITSQFNRNSTSELEQRIESRSAIGVWKILQETWWYAPDSRELHSIPGWGVLCDLCSEFEYNEEEIEEFNKEE